MVTLVDLPPSYSPRQVPQHPANLSGIGHTVAFDSLEKSCGKITAGTSDPAS